MFKVKPTTTDTEKMGREEAYKTEGSSSSAVIQKSGRREGGLGGGRLNRQLTFQILHVETTHGEGHEK